nr:hypothetical protein [Nitrosopumilus sp.]
MPPNRLRLAGKCHSLYNKLGVIPSTNIVRRVITILGLMGEIRLEKVILNRKSSMPDMTFQKNWQSKSFESERQQLKGLEKDNENHNLALLESRQHNLKLERAIELLQNRIDELISEKTIIYEESNELKNALENANTHTYQLERKLSHEIHQKSELEQEINALYKQFDVLKNLVETHKKALLDQQKATEDAQIALKNQQEQNLEIKESFSAYKDEIEHLKQQIFHGLQDAKEVQNRLAEAVSEREETQRVLQQQRREYDKQQLELLDIKERLGAYIAREKKDRFAFDEKISHLNTIQAATETKLKLSLFENKQLLERLDLAQIENDLHQSQFLQLKEIKAQFNNAQTTHKEEIYLLEEQLQQASQEIALLHNANDQLQQEIIAVTVLNEEMQLQLDEAQHHLAKKVRESALQNEKIEAFLLREIEAGNVHEALHQANTLLQNDLHAKEKKIKEY